MNEENTATSTVARNTGQISRPDSSVPEIDVAVKKSTSRNVVLEVRDITKVYDISDDIQVRALAGVSMQVVKGEMIAIIGPSGSGKSTLMHSIGLLDHPTTGHVLVSDTDVTNMAPNDLAAVRNKEIGFVFQAFNLLSRTTAVENVELPLIYAGVNAVDRRVKATEALQRVGLGDRLDHSPNQLSGGQQQRVAVARALVTNPAIVLADEPTGNLDSKSSIEVMMILQELNEAGITIVIVTHDTEVAMHATRVVKIGDGRVVEDYAVSPEQRIDAREEMAEYLAAHKEDEEA